MSFHSSPPSATDRKKKNFGMGDVIPGILRFLSLGQQSQTRKKLETKGAWKPGQGEALQGIKGKHPHFLHNHWKCVIIYKASSTVKKTT